MHQNIIVMRHPDHTVVEGINVTLFWAHHEKLLLVDRRKAFMGGIDLCYGRWDLPYHPIADIHPDNPYGEVFYGQEYNNSRIQDFSNVDQPGLNTLDKGKFSRMGWHDVGLQVNGPVCTSLEQHFVERWEFLRKFKYMMRPKYVKLEQGVIDTDPDFELDLSEAISHKMKNLKMGNYKEAMHSRKIDPGSPQTINLPSPQSKESAEGVQRGQIVRSIGDWSHGYLIEKSIQNAYIELISNSKHSFYIENQFFIAGGKDLDGSFHNLIGDAIVERILRAARAGEKFRALVFIPAIPAFPGDLKDDASIGIRAIMYMQYLSICRGGKSIRERISQQGFNPDDYIQFYNLRSYDRILPKRHEAFKAVKYDDTIEDLNSDISRFKSLVGQAHKTGRPTISICALQGQAPVSQQTWTYDSNEAEAFVSELLYIHSKLLIVDDSIVLCGSANINDRSQEGDHDSEIAIVLENPPDRPTVIDGQSASVSSFATSFRRQLVRNHLGLINPPTLMDDLVSIDELGKRMKPLPDSYEYDFGSEEDSFVQDPLSDELWDYMKQTAEVNKNTYEKLFHCVPTNNVHTWDDYKKWREPIITEGHVVREFKDSPQVIKEELDQVKGFIIPMAYEFLKDEVMVKSGLQYNELIDQLYT